MFLLHFQHVFEYRGRSLVWFIIGLVGPLTMILFWNGAAKSSNGTLQFGDIAAYYLLLIPISITLTSHIEEDIAYEDIRDGGLSKYLTRPFSFFWIKVLEESPNRILQGGYGVIIVTGLSFFFPVISPLFSDIFYVVLLILICLLGYILSFTYKSLIGFVAFWLTDIGGFLQFENMIFFVFSGVMMPLSLLPEQITKIAYALPFAYMIYYPVRAVQGKLELNELFLTIFIQLVWIMVMYVGYMLMWRIGIKKFTAVGQ